jgi:hypothetical protein
MFITPIRILKIFTLDAKYSIFSAKWVSSPLSFVYSRDQYILKIISPHNFQQAHRLSFSAECANKKGDVNETCSISALDGGKQAAQAISPYTRKRVSSTY